MKWLNIALQKFGNSPNSQLNKFRSGIENSTEITLNLSSKVVGDTNDEANFPHKWLLTYIQVSRFRKAFTNGSSDNIKCSKTQLSKMIQLGGITGNLINCVGEAMLRAGAEGLKKG